MATCGLARAGRTHHFSISSADGTLISQTMDLGSYDFQHSCSPFGPIIYPKDSTELVLDGKYEKDMQLVVEVFVACFAADATSPRQFLIFCCEAVVPVPLSRV